METVEMKRDHRRVTEFVFAEALVVPLAAVKLVIWMATDWPRCRADVSLAPLKFPMAPPTARPFVSTRKPPVTMLLRVTFTGSPRPKLPIFEFVAAGSRSVVMIENCVPLLALDTTVPSTVSTTGEARSGSISWTAKVPSELRIASMLAA